MNPTVGWAREKLGRTVNKVMLLRNVGEFLQEEPVYKTEIHSDGTKTVTIANEPKKVIKWRVVAQRYFGHWERFWELGHGKTKQAYELKLENESYGRGEVHVQFIDFDTGDALNFTGRVKAAMSPQNLQEAIDVKVVKEFGNRLKGANFMAIWFLVGFAIGGLLLFMVGQNWDGIAAAVSHIGASNPTPPPPTTNPFGGA